MKLKNIPSLFKKTIFSKGKKNRKALLYVIISVLVALLLIFLAAQSISNVTLSKVTDRVKESLINLKPGGGYPYSFSSDGAVLTDCADSDLVVLSEGYFTVLNSNAKELFHESLTYTNPGIKISNGRILIYDRGSTSFVLTGKSDYLYDSDSTKKVLKGKIINANIGKDGTMAFATWSDEGLTEISVYNKKLVREFYYVFNKERIINVAVSDNGKFAAAAVLGAENAALYSNIYVFDTSKDKPIKTFKIDGETLIGLNFLDNKRISAVTTEAERTFYFRDKRDYSKYDSDYSAHKLSDFDFDKKSKRSTVCVSEYGSNKFILYAFYSNGKKSCEITDLENVKSVCSDKNNIVVQTNDKLLCYDYFGKLKGESELTYNVDKIEISSGKVYLFSGSKIYKCNPRRNQTLKVKEK